MRIIVYFLLLQCIAVFNCDRETFAVTMNMLDRYLAAVNMRHRQDLQIVGATALFLATKATSVNNTFISVDDIAVFLGGICDARTIKVYIIAELVICDADYPVSCRCKKSIF